MHVGGDICDLMYVTFPVGNCRDELRKLQITLDYQRAHTELFFAPFVVEANDLELAHKGVVLISCP